MNSCPFRTLQQAFHPPPWLRNYAEVAPRGSQPLRHGLQAVRKASDALQLLKGLTHNSSYGPTGCTSDSREQRRPTMVALPLPSARSVSVSWHSSKRFQLVPFTQTTTFSVPAQPSPPTSRSPPPSVRCKAWTNRLHTPAIQSPISMQGELLSHSLTLLHPAITLLEGCIHLLGNQAEPPILQGDAAGSHASGESARKYHRRPYCCLPIW